MSHQRVLVLLPSYDSGGSENYALRLIRFAGNGDFEWHVTSGNLKNRRLEPAFAAAGASVHVASPGFANPAKSWQFYRFLKKFKFDAVMSLIGIFGGLPLAQARCAGVSIRLAWHRRSTPAYKQTPLRKLYAQSSLTLLNWGATKILSNSRAALERFHGKKWNTSNHFQIIPNGVDTERFRPRPEIRSPIRKSLGIPNDAYIIGHVGRVDPAKDHDTLLAAVRELRSSWSDVRLLLVGTETDSPRFQQRLRDHQIEDISMGLGVREDVHDLYQAMNLFMFPSVTEGQPNALLEAMLCGVPVVATDIPPIREALPESLHEQLVPPRDIQQAVATALKLRESPNGLEQPARDWAAERYNPATNFALVLGLLQT